MADFTLPSANQGYWTSIGIPGGVEQYAAGGALDRAVEGTLVDMTAAPYSVDDTGAVDCSSIIQDAVDDASGPTVLFFPEGVYKIGASAVQSNLKPSITIRGEVGTRFHCSGTGSCFNFTDPGGISTNERTVTGTKTKGTTVLTITTTTGYTVDAQIAVEYENEVDDTRIIAGAAPVWNSAGSAWMRRMHAKVTAVGGGTITIDPPLPADGTSLAVRTRTSALDWLTVGWAFEDFQVTFDAENHPTQFATVNTGAYNWFFRVDFSDFSKDDSNGSCIRFFGQYRSEIRKCKFHAEPGASSDGAVEGSFNSSCFIEDNIASGDFGVFYYDSGGSMNNVLSYNACPDNYVALFHNAHPSLNLLEGNFGLHTQSDGYHGSSSNNTLYRNRLSGAIILNRFKNSYCLAGNIVENISWGNPNIGNGAADGFAGPTGLSDQEGETDYSQPGYATNEYVIQAGDIFVGDFWSDWEITGEIIDRISDTVAVFDVSGGNWFTGGSPTGASALLVTVHWNSKANNLGNGTVTAVDGSEVTITFAGGVLPALSTEVQMYFGPAGWQERDLDVQATAILASNSVGEILQSDIAPDTLPASLIHPSKPAFFGALAWPPFDPYLPEDSSAISIPAGERYYAGLPPSAPEITTPCTVTGTPVQGNTLTAVPGTVTGNPPPTRTWRWERDGTPIVGATSVTYLLTGDDIGFEVGPVQIETNSEGFDESEATPLEITAFQGDILTTTTVANVATVTELRLRAPLTGGVAGTFIYHLMVHSGPYPTQSDNNFAHKRFGTPMDQIYVFQGNVTLANAIASVP